MFRVVLAALAIVLLLASCGGGGTDTTVNSKLASNVTIVDLLVGQDLDVGYVSITDSGDTLTVTYVVEAADWYLKQTHLAVGDSLDDIPQKNGNPIPGQFPYHTDYSLADMVTTDTYVIDITGLGDPLYVAAHAKLVNLSDGNATELHFNEGFEYPTLPSPLGLRDGNPIGGTGSSDWDVFLSDDIPDWNVVWTTDLSGNPDGVTPGYLEYWGTYNEGPPRLSGQCVELDSDGHGSFNGGLYIGYGAGRYNNVQVTATIADLSDNCFLNFSWRPRRANIYSGTYDCQMEVGFGPVGSPVAIGLPAYNYSVYNNLNWHEETLLLNTSGLTSGDLYFKETGFPAYSGSPAGANGGYGTLLEDVSVVSYGNGVTGWSDGPAFVGKNWATYTEHDRDDS